MTQLIPSFDPTLDLPTGSTSFMTERNAHEVRCGMCAREIYVDDETYLLGNDRIDAGLDSPFRCEICAEEYDELSYET